MHTPHECLSAVTFWNSSAGLEAFRKLVSALVHPPPDPNDPHVRHSLRTTVPPMLVANSNADVDARVHAAAKDVAERLRLTREKMRRFYEFCERPVPPRHSTYAGASDRAGQPAERAAPVRSNPYFAKWAAENG